MTDYKLVPIDPTPEMVEAAADAYMPFGDMDLALRMALLAAPAVQGEAAAWQLRTQDERLLQSAANSLRGYALELMLSHTLENGEWPDGEEDAKAHHDHMRALAKGLEELKAARTEAVQGEPVYLYRRLGLNDFVTCDFTRYTELSGKPNFFETKILYAAPQPAEQQPVAEVKYGGYASGNELVWAKGAGLQFLPEGTKLYAASIHAPTPVAYLDVGAGGYMDLGTDLTEDQVGSLPWGRHILAIVGTYGADGYVPAEQHPAPDVAEILNRIIPRIDAGGPNPIDPDIHCCEWTLHRERERIHAEFADALAARRKQGGES